MAYVKTMTYNEFIQNIIDTRGQWNIPDGEYWEGHHIIPVCMGGEGNSRKKHDNIIWLYPHEHFVAHKLLFEENPTNRKLAAAWLMMAFPKGTTKRYFSITPEEYEELRNVFNKCSWTDEEKLELSKKIKLQYESGRVTWNKGLTKETNSSIMRQSKCLSEKFKGENNPMSNYTLTEEQHKHYRDAAVIRENNPELKQRKSEKLKLLRNTTNPSWNSKKVRCIETNDVFPSLAKACKFIGINNTKGLKMSCSDKSVTFGGYHWEYINE